MSGPGGGMGVPDEAWKAAENPDRDGPRRGRWFGDGARWGGAGGTGLLVLALVALAVLFLAVSCLG